MCSIQMIAMPRRAELLDRRHKLERFGVSETTADLVEEQHLGVGGERASELESLAIEQAEICGSTVGDIDETARLEDVDGSLVRSSAAPMPAPSIAPTSTFSNTVMPTNGRGI